MTFKDLRFKRFICWLLTGHKWDTTKSKHLASRTMNRCEFCDSYVAGPE